MNNQTLSHLNLYKSEGWWRLVPESLSSWDQMISFELAHNAKLHSDFWQGVENFSENHWGMSTLGILLFVFFLYWRSKYFSIKPYSLANLKLISLIAIGAGLNDFLSNQLKHLFGRAKPFVTHLEEGKKVALSFPSNHASNTSFLFVLLFFFLIHEQKNIGPKQKLIFVTVGGLFVLLTASSRVFFGEHYVLDVLFGILVGSFTAYLYKKLCLFLGHSLI